LPVDGNRAARHAAVSVRGERVGREAGPEHHPVGGGVTGGDAQPERIRWHGGGDVGERRRLDAEHEGGRTDPGEGEEGPATGSERWTRITHGRGVWSTVAPLGGDVIKSDDRNRRASSPARDGSPSRVAGQSAEGGQRMVP